MSWLRGLCHWLRDSLAVQEVSRLQLGIEYAPAPPSVLQAVLQRLESIRPDRIAVTRRTAQALRAA